MPRLWRVASFLDDYLRVSEHPEERNGVLAGADAAVRRLGVALEPGPGLDAWVRRLELDAVVLHRAWGLDVSLLPPGTGVLAYHLPFDERLTLGENRLLAKVLGIRDPEPLGSRQGRSIGMIGRAPDARLGSFGARVEREFRGVEKVVPARSEGAERVAVVGAMTDELVREAAARGASVYLTGQLRAPALRAVDHTGIGVIATGHRRAEEWGVRALAGLLRRECEGLEVFTGEEACPAPPRD